MLSASTAAVPSGFQPALARMSAIYSDEKVSNDGELTVFTASIHDDLRQDAKGSVGRPVVEAITTSGLGLEVLKEVQVRCRICQYCKSRNLVGSGEHIPS